MKYDKEKLLKATAAEFLFSALMSASMVDSTEGYGLIIFCFIVSVGWLFLFALANHFY